MATVGVGEQVAGNSLRFAKIIKTHAPSHSVDVVYADDGTRACGVQVMTSRASTNSGVVDLPEPSTPDDDEWSPKPTNPYGDNDKRDMLAVVAMVGVTPVVIGYVFPQVNHLAMPEGTHLTIDRHGSDLTVVTEDNANHTIMHPGGSYIHIGNGTKPNLEGQDYDEVFKIYRNKTSANIALHTNRASIVIEAGGDIAIYAERDIAINAGNNISITAGNIISANADLITLN